MKLIISIILLLLMSIYFFYLFFSYRRRAKVFYTWNPVEIDIIEKKIKPNQGRSSKDSYTISVFYRYTVDGIEYESSNLYFEILSGFSGKNSRRQAEKLLVKLQKNMQGRVNPKNPGESAIFPMPSWIWLAPAFGSLFFFLFFLFALIVKLAE